MSFRKRNLGVPGSSRAQQTGSTLGADQNLQGAIKRVEEKLLPKGVRPSTIDGSPITSTGTPSLDSLLAGHGGLVLGNSLLIEESGVTDYAGTLLRYYAAEGLTQDHRLHIVGADESWVRELPGITLAPSSRAVKEKSSSGKAEKLKIAWRYERFSEPSATSRGPSQRLAPLGANQGRTELVFCHDFDLTKRLEIPSDAKISFLKIGSSPPTSSPFDNVLKQLISQLDTSEANSIHRVVIPSILSPAQYPTSSSLPQHILRFLHALRSMLRQYADRLSAVISLPITLYPRDSGLTRWLELLSDGVLELTPFPHTVDIGPSLIKSGAATAQEEKPQGMAKLHRLPVFHERGGGMPGLAGIGDDLAFTVTRKRFVIKPFSLPPVEGDVDAQKGHVESGAVTADLEF